MDILGVMLFISMYIIPILNVYLGIKTKSKFTINTVLITVIIQHYALGMGLLWACDSSNELINNIQIITGFVQVISCLYLVMETMDENK